MPMLNMLRGKVNFFDHLKGSEGNQNPPNTLTSSMPYTYNGNTLYGGVVKLVITSACHAEGREFESRRSRHFRSRQSGES